MISVKEIIDQLNMSADSDYQKFSASLIPGNHLILGVRLPTLHKLAKKIALEDWCSFLAITTSPCFEFTMLQALVIGYADCDIETRLKYIRGFLPKIDNWSICDSFVSNLKIINNHLDEFWDFIHPLLKSNHEYTVRFAAVTLKHYYLTPAYIQDVLQLLNQVEHYGYYSRMAVAWAYSSAFNRFPDTTLDYLKNNSFDPFIYNKTLQKIIESKKIDSKNRESIRILKKRSC